MFINEYNQIIREHFDLSDRNTRRYIATLEDAGQEQLLSALSSALYDKIVTKVDDIDFGTIPMSRGDITKVEGFASTEECLDIIRKIVIEYKQNPAIVDVVLSAIQNIKERKALFMKGYALNMELPMVIYNCMVLSIERSTSLMIATCLEYVKDSNSSSPKAALDKVAYQRTMDDVLFKQLISFNNMCKDGSLDKIIEASMKMSVKEEVEFTPIDPIIPDTNSDDIVKDPVEDSPLTPDTLVDPFSGDEIAPQDNTSEPEETADVAEIIPDKEPEEVPQETEDTASPSEDDEDIDLDVEIVPVSSDEPEEDVEPQSIPAVVPGEEVTPTDRPLNETNAATVATIAAGTIVALASIPFIIKGLAWGITKVFIPFLRVTVYTLYFTRMKFVDYLEIQADLLEANAVELEYSSSTLSDDKKKNVVKKQMKTVEKLRKWSNIFSIDSKTTNNTVAKEVKKDENDKMTIAKNSEGDDSIW